MKNGMADAVAYLHMKIITGDKESFDSLGLLSAENIQQKLLAKAFNYEESLYAAEMCTDLKLLDKYAVCHCSSCNKENFYAFENFNPSLVATCIYCDNKFAPTNVRNKYAVSQVHLPYESGEVVKTDSVFKKLIRLFKRNSDA